MSLENGRPSARRQFTGNLMPDAEGILTRLHRLANPETAKQLGRFFKTGPGEYGQGDRFLGIRVPALKKRAREWVATDLATVVEVLHSVYHEARLVALLILVGKYKRARSRAEERSIYRTYLRNTSRINNWDLVDVSAEHIVGAYLFSRDRKPLYRLARSRILWERRIAILSTFHFIRQGDFTETLALAEILLADDHDLIHKAVGWMLREVGNRDRTTEEAFLRQHGRTMPRTMLRYAIEKFPEPLRLHYLRGKD